jgi:hypothetical protein
MGQVNTIALHGLISLRAGRDHNSIFRNHGYQINPSVCCNDRGHVGEGIPAAEPTREAGVEPARNTDRPDSTGRPRALAWRAMARL